jgi:hypothetical protein
MTAMALRSRKGFKPECAECATDPCHEPTMGGSDELGCPVCRSKAGFTECVWCEGTGYVRFKECPIRAIAREPGLQPFLLCYDLMQMGHMPVAGGVVEQAHYFMQAVRVAAEVAAELREGAE